jgi:hypothetical protein
MKVRKKNCEGINPALKARFFYFFFISPAAQRKEPLIILPSYSLYDFLLLTYLMIELSDYGVRVVARVNLILTWMAVLICVRNAFVCYGQWKRTRGLM